MYNSILAERAPFPPVTTVAGRADMTIIPRWGDVLDFQRQGHFSRMWPNAEHGWHRPDAAGAVAVVLMVAELGRYASHAAYHRMVTVVPLGGPSDPDDGWR